jgi:uncharacterized flavoprotein (TIGR03862 family)
MYKIIHIIGTGPAALMAGTILSSNGNKVHFYDQKSTPGRKFLVAGNGGFNLTHSEKVNEFIKKYNHKLIQKSVENFSNNDFIEFLNRINIPTYIGSSGKIFPEKGIKPIEVLQKWIEHLKLNKCIFHFNSKFIDFTENDFTIEVAGNKSFIKYETLILALGGASWKKTGSTGEWINLLTKKGIECKDFEASNSGFEIEDWEKNKGLEGFVFKNCNTKLGTTEKLGEVVITNYGLEGAPIYFLNKIHRLNNDLKLNIDFKPNKALDEIKKILEKAKNHSEGLKNLKLSKTTQTFIKLNTSKEEFSSTIKLSQIIKSFPFKIKSLRPIEEVISTIGGISMEAVNNDYSLKTFPNIYTCGEMLNWDAPTGGYLIQGCVSTGYDCAQNIISK